MAAELRGSQSAFAAIERLAAANLTAQELLEEAAARIERVVPTDGYFVGATDPQTTLCLGPGVVRDLPADQCGPTWEHEFLVPDYLKFADIARSPLGVGDLHDATGGRPERSPRWRRFGSATGYRSEVRVAWTLGGAVWGVGQFDRLGDAPRFSDAEKAWLGRLSPILAAGLRRAMVSQPALTPTHRGPGMLVLDAEGRTISSTPEAQAWLEELDPWSPVPGTEGDRLPFGAHAYTSQVRAGSGAAPGRARLRTRTGVWLLLHASRLRGTDQLAVMIAPARANDVAPLIVEAYGLTQRELDVTRAIARGLGTAEIAAHLLLSPHTVRDHVKAVFEKVGVSSRGELVAKVFAEHYGPVTKHL